MSEFEKIARHLISIGRPLPHKYALEILNQLDLSKNLAKKNKKQVKPLSKTLITK